MGGGESKPPEGQKTSQTVYIVHWQATYGGIPLNVCFLKNFKCSSRSSQVSSINEKIFNKRVFFNVYN